MPGTRRRFLNAIGALAAGTLAPRLIMPAAAEKKKYKACIIGDGGQGGFGHHLHRVFSKRADVAVVGLADPVEETRREGAEESGALRTYGDYHLMLEKEKPDLVVIGPRWTIHHREYLLAAADAGAHGLIEKPIAKDLEDADAMVEAAASKNLKWAIAFQKRLSPNVVEVERRVFQGDLIGEVLELRGRGKEDRRAGGEDLVVLGPHVFDLMVSFLGEQPYWCEAKIGVNGVSAEPSDVHDPLEGLGPVVGNQITASFGFPGGIPGYFSTLTNRDGNGGRFGLDIYGSKGIVKIRLTGVPVVAWRAGGSWSAQDGVAEWRSIFEDPSRQPEVDVDELNRRVINDLLDAIESDRPPKLDLRDGLAAHEMTQGIFESHVRGGRVSLPLEKRKHPLEDWG